MTAYLVTYTAIARNVATADLATALAAIPRDVLTEELLGLSSLADVTTAAPPYVTRSMSYTSEIDPMIPNPELGAFLTNFYTTRFSQALSTPVVTSPVSTVGEPFTLGPILWLRADAGAPGPSVSDWRDLSGNGNDGLQAVTINQPALAVNVAEDISVVRFGGTALLTSANPLAFDEFTYFETFVSPLLSTAGLLFERGANANAAADGENVFQSIPNSAAIRRGGTTHEGNASANWAIDGHWHLIVYRYTHADGASLTLDGAEIVALAAVPVTPVSALLHLGARVGVTLGMTGDVREVLAFGEGLDAASIASISAYMRAQVGI